MGNADSKEMVAGSSEVDNRPMEKELLDSTETSKETLTERSSSDQEQAPTKEKGAPENGQQDPPAALKGDGAARKHSRRRSKSNKSKKNDSVATPRRKNRSHHAGQQPRDAAATNHQQITDEQVHVNLAMSDLMAYLQVVANNSSQLPATKRDDPDLDRFVPSLDPEDYARKSAAFIPADVRVIGGTFTRYGRVWDLPTSEVRMFENLLVES